ncbi:MAG: bifunctional glutamate N-acetyltransferase/amino-acid acetyltransferase ArgJ [Thermoplasmatota archaeon]
MRARGAAKRATRHPAGPRVVANGGLVDVPGFKSQGYAAGIKRKRRDVAILFSTVPDTSCAAVFTQNRVVAAPVLVSKRVAARGNARALVVNSGCANAATGPQGLLDAETMQRVTASSLGIAANEVLVCSTGVIGRPLPMDIVTEGIRKAVGTLDANERGAAAQAIMTTDTFAKEVLVEASVGGAKVRVAGIAKGAGMIHPNMATMLAFVATDAKIAPARLKAMLARVADRTFNMISVDGDTSTNDTLAVFANGLAANPTTSAALAEFEAALELACRELALAIVRDGEGATTLIETRVVNAGTAREARQAARTIVSSSLVKSAVFGRDPNWGRILAAVGRSGARFDPARVDVEIGNPAGRAKVLEAGEPCETLDAEGLRRLIDAKHVVFVVDLHAGKYDATAWGCDLTYDYVKINADYTT